MDVEYEGTRYHGWQIQVGVLTIQQVLEETLARILGEGCRVVGAGRTDAGVHAWGQVAHFNTRNPIACHSLLMAMNSLLPEDVVIRDLSEVSVDFHARKSARKKRYEYWIRNHGLPSVFSRRFAWHIKRPLDVGAMTRAARGFPGVRDFSSLQASGSSPGTNFVRVFSLVEIEDMGASRLRVSVEGDSFLRQMVRILVGTLVEVGLGRTREGDIAAILSARDRRRAGVTAPAQGLFLKWVQYPEGSSGTPGPGFDPCLSLSRFDNNPACR